MADVELIIKIPEEEYKKWKIKGDLDMSVVKNAMAIKSLEQEPCEDCISRADALSDKGLGTFHYYEDYARMRNYLKNLPPVTPKPETVTEFVDLCKECGAKYGKLLKERSWIPCNEKLPDQHKHVLVTTCEGYIEIGYYDGKAWSVGDGIFYRTDEISAWYPLPEPYKECEEE